MLNKVVYRLRIHGKSYHVGPEVWCWWWIVWSPKQVHIARTPYFNSCGSDVDLLVWIVWVRPVKYDWNQSKTLRRIPNDDSYVWSKRWRPIVSNAPLRLSRTSIAPLWVSTAWRGLFWTRRRVVTVLCSWRYADWKTSYRSWAFRWSTSCTHTIRYISLDKKERFAADRNFFQISQSSMAFFMSGEMKVNFNSGEKSLSSREVFPVVRTRVPLSLWRLTYTFSLNVEPL